MSQFNEVMRAFARTTDEVLSLDEWRELLGSGRKLRIKFGVDVTAPELHIGHAVNLFMLRKLQDLGHTVIFLIGDFTTQIGDPTGKSKTRPVISKEEIEKNIELFIAQAKMVLRFDDPTLLEIRRNSEWFDVMPMGEFMQLLSSVTHGHLLSRDMFQQRVANGGEIRMHEIVYPILQAWDSVRLNADVTIIGSDQLFNEMLGREFQKKQGQAPQVVITTKIVPGLCGVHKQSKSLGNFVGLNHSPRDKFGRVMTLPDRLIEEWFMVFTDVPEEEISVIMRSEPFIAKKRLAQTIVERFHGSVVAQKEKDWFEKTFSERSTPADVSVMSIDSPSMEAWRIVKKFFGETKSASDVRRLIVAGAVRRNEEKLLEPTAILSLVDGDVFRVGKRDWFRVELQ